MYIFIEFRKELVEILRLNDRTYDHINILYCVRNLTIQDGKSMYENIREFVPLKEVYDYLGIFSGVKSIFCLKYFEYFPMPKDTTWDLEIYKLSKKLPNLSIGEILEIFDMIYLSTYGENFKYYDTQMYIGGEEMANKIHKKLNEVYNTYETIFLIFTEEAVRCNNNKVSPLSWLWWEQYSDCYTLWFPREIYEDVFELLDETYDYTTLVELF